MEVLNIQISIACQNNYGRALIRGDVMPLKRLVTPDTGAPLWFCGAFWGVLGVVEGRPLDWGVFVALVEPLSSEVDNPLLLSTVWAGGIADSLVFAAGIFLMPEFPESWWLLVFDATGCAWPELAGCTRKKLKQNTSISSKGAPMVRLCESCKTCIPIIVLAATLVLI